MIYALEHNKISAEARSAFKVCEDTLTSSIFGTLMYLPVEMFWDILKKSCYSDDLPSSSGKLDFFDFWPNWSAEGIKDKDRVEPDLFIRFERFDLIIEAKRWDTNQQSRDQWSQEYKAYMNEYSQDSKEVYFLAVGGIREESTEKLYLENKYPLIVKTKWRLILREVKSCIKELHDIDNSGNSSLQNILNSLIISFRLHGYFIGEWLDNENFGSCNKINEKSLETLERWIIKKN